MKNTVTTIIIATLITIALLVFTTAICYGTGYLGGMILSAIVGEQIAATLNSVFNTTHFTSDMIPSICGIIAVIGNFFKSRVSNKNNND